MKSKIHIYETESQYFNPKKHISSRIKEMEKKSVLGAQLAKRWTEILNQSLNSETYPVIHPIGQETFSLYAEYPTGIFEYALDIDGAASLIKGNDIKPVQLNPSDIIDAVDQGNINKDPKRIKPNHKNPVMVLQSRYLTHNKPYCINGNHRIFEAYHNNDKQIEVYVFEDLEFVPFFYDALSKAIYYLEIDYCHVVNEK
ncbi:hypothetical protein [Cytobacillus gottheilii]|uniref:hypothetical protein n=1 Tax=Cytobacillus gottheilii TaxID=859144 RepID=UPI0009BB06FE|nr:hypothetical protein [Cytobacillus gottheilii]